MSAATKEWRPRRNREQAVQFMLAPENIGRVEIYNFQSEIWAAGQVFYFMLTGKIFDLNLFLKSFNFQKKIFKNFGFRKIKILNFKKI